MYLITNRNLCNEDRYFEVIKECMENRVENIIIREKDLDNNSLEILCKNNMLKSIGYQHVFKDWVRF